MEGAVGLLQTPRGAAAHSDVSRAVYFGILDLRQVLTSIRLSLKRKIAPASVLPFPHLCLQSVGMHTEVDADEISQLHHVYQERWCLLDDTVPVSR